ncbi:hypothetical protein, partial [Vibrio cholerae]|uniref:hypothetical protein n=1 Tax=Vibrio cholerae TaxID=666 RepID=UPI001F1F6D6B
HKVTYLSLRCILTPLFRWPNLLYHYIETDNHKDYGKELVSQDHGISYLLHSLGFLRKANARLRGWQRIITKLKHNNCNHRGSLGLETPRVDSPY